MTKTKINRERSRQNKRLLNVAKALRESPDPDNFNMSQYFTTFEQSFNKRAHCGTPRCAFGHYAFRRDLQKTFKIDTSACSWIPVNNSGDIMGAGQIFVTEKFIQDHFGITKQEEIELFSANGCEFARTNIQAAKYIESFVKARQ